MLETVWGLFESSLGVDTVVVDVSFVMSIGGPWAGGTCATAGAAAVVPPSPPVAALPPLALWRQNFQMAAAMRPVPATAPTTMPAMAPPESPFLRLGRAPEPDEPSEWAESDPPGDPLLPPFELPSEPPDEPPEPPDEAPPALGDALFEGEESPFDGEEPDDWLGMPLSSLVAVTSGVDSELEPGMRPASTLIHSCSPAT